MLWIRTKPCEEGFLTVKFHHFDHRPGANLHVVTTAVKCDALSDEAHLLLYFTCAMALGAQPAKM